MASIVARKLRLIVKCADAKVITGAPGNTSINFSAAASERTGLAVYAIRLG
jgi:hypothetical protein